MRKIMDRITYRQWVQAIALSLLLTVGWGTTLYAQTPEENAEPGVLIVSVQPDSPAAAANIVRGDIILSVNGEEVNEPLALMELIQNAEPGDTVELTVLHGDEERLVAVTLADLDGTAFLGVRPYVDVASMTPGEMMPGEMMPGEMMDEMMDEMMPEQEETAETTEAITGVAVVTVAEGTPAEAAGLRPGDVIIRVDGETVADAEALVERIGTYAPGDEVVLEVISPAAETAGDSEDDASDEEAESEEIRRETTEIVVVLAAHPEDEARAYLGVQVVSAAENATEDDGPTEMMPHRVIPYVPGYPMPRGGYTYPGPEYDSPDDDENGPRAYRFWMQPHRPDMKPGQRFYWRHHRPHNHHPYHHPYSDDCRHNYHQ